MAADGLTTIRSSYEPEETMNRLKAEIKARGMTVFAQIDHASGAAEIGLPLRPTNLLIFGNAKRRHTAYAIYSDYRDRSTSEEVGLAGCIGQHMAFV